MILEIQMGGLLIDNKYWQLTSQDADKLLVTINTIHDDNHTVELNLSMGTKFVSTVCSSLRSSNSTLVLVSDTTIATGLPCLHIAAPVQSLSPSGSTTDRYYQDLG